MSLFRKATLACPACGEPVEFYANFSVNADRRPDFRDKILARDFQRGACGSCGRSFRLDPEMTYLDVGRHQWILVRPLDALADWPDLEEQAGAIFAEVYGEGASETARGLARGMSIRVTFGWAALREKIVCAEAGIDDLTLECVKMAVLRGLPSPPIADDVELRLEGADDDDLELAWIEAASERVVETLSVPRALYDEIAADPDAWAPLRDEMSAGPFVDIHRLLVEPDPVEDAA